MARSTSATVSEKVSASTTARRSPSRAPARRLTCDQRRSGCLTRRSACCTKFAGLRWRRWRLFLLLILATYDPQDPSWSHVVETEYDSQRRRADRRLVLRLVALPDRPVLLPAGGDARGRGCPRHSGTPQSRGPEAAGESDDLVARFAWERWLGFMLFFWARTAWKPRACTRLMPRCHWLPAVLSAMRCPRGCCIALGAVGGPC